jgi:predicted amidohydrolase YtcJ
MTPRPGQLERAARLGLVMSTQPSMIYSEGDSWLALLGEERVRGFMPMRSLLAAGLRVQINSDYPCSPLNPFIGIQAAVDRTTRDGVVLGADEAVTVSEAIGMMTREPAITINEGDRAGCLRPGSFGDAIVVDLDPFELPAQRLAEVTVETTVLDGRVVFSREG